MRSVIGWVSAALCGSIAWWLGAHIGIPLAIILSAVAGGFGLYYGFRWFDENLK